MSENKILLAAKRVVRSVTLLPVGFARFKAFYVLHRRFMEADKRLSAVNAQMSPIMFDQTRAMALQNAKIALMVRELIEHPNDPSQRESMKRESEQFESIVREFEERLRPLQESAEAIRRELAEIEHQQEKLETLESVQSFVG